MKKNYVLVKDHLFMWRMNIKVSYKSDFVGNPFHHEDMRSRADSTAVHGLECTRLMDWSARDSCPQVELNHHAHANDFLRFAYDSGVILCYNMRRNEQFFSRLADSCRRR